VVFTPTTKPALCGARNGLSSHKKTAVWGTPQFFIADIEQRVVWSAQQITGQNAPPPPPPKPPPEKPPPPPPKPPPKPEPPALERGAETNTWCMSLDMLLMELLNRMGFQPYPG
jgi:hypothetical protein